MLRNFGISLLLLALFVIGVDGFRARTNQVTPTSSANTTLATDDGAVHSAEFGVGSPIRP